MIKFHFKRGGEVLIRPSGYPGNMCHEATRPYEDAFGGVQHCEEWEDDDVVVGPHQHRQEEVL